MKTVKMSKDTLDNMRDNIEYYKTEYHIMRERFINVCKENAELKLQNKYLYGLFDKEGDTEVVKYNGKLYRIVSTQHCKGDGDETLDISLVPVSEVNLDGD